MEKIDDLFCVCFFSLTFGRRIGESRGPLCDSEGNPCQLPTTGSDTRAQVIHNGRSSGTNTALTRQTPRPLIDSDERPQTREKPEKTSQEEQEIKSKETRQNGGRNKKQWPKEGLNQDLIRIKPGLIEV